jgi:hypothetical protein
MPTKDANANPAVFIGDLLVVGVFVGVSSVGVTTSGTSVFLLNTILLTLEVDV